MFEGRHAIPRDRITEGLALQGEGAWPWSRGTHYRRSLFDLDARRIEALYAAHGYFDARVTQKAATPANKVVDLRLVIFEGKPTHIKSIRIDGLPDEGEPSERTALRALPVHVGERFHHADYEKAKEDLLKTLRRHGYAHASVTGGVRVHAHKRTANILFKVRARTRVRLGEPHFLGSTDVPRLKLKRLVAWEAKDLYNKAHIDQTRQHLLETNLFSTVQIDLPQDEGAQKVTIRLEPTHRRELRLGGGLGVERRRHEVRLIGRFVWRNFLGGMRILEARVRPAFVTIPNAWASSVSGPAVENTLRLTQPDIFSTGASLFVVAGYDLGIHEGYRFHGPRGQLGVERSFWGRRLTAQLSWNAEFFDFFAQVTEAFDEQDTPLGFGFRDPYRLTWLEQALQLDLRDSAIDPRAGIWAEIRFEEGFASIGSDFSYFKVLPQIRAYIPLGTKRLILGLRGQFGHLIPSTFESPDGTVSVQDSPVTRRFNFGGPTSHRGFGYGRLSPQQARQSDGRRVPLGGNAAFLLSADLRLRLIKFHGGWVNISAFVDGGDVTRTLPDLSFDDLHWAVGASSTYETPIGAIRFSVGVRVVRVGEDLASSSPDPNDRLAFHLTLGDAF